MKLNEEEQKMVKEAFLLTAKPTLYVANISQEQMNKDDEYTQAVRDIANSEGAEYVPICADIETELTQLDADELEEYKKEFGIKELGLNRLIKASYKLLGLISYLTAGEKEVRAWTIKKGTKAPGAAGVIHTDFERGFIKAEVVSYGTLVACGGYLQAKEAGKVRMEGKDYVVQDGDVMLFRFNV